MHKVLFADTAHPVLEIMLENAGFNCSHYYGSDLQYFISLLNDIEGVIIRSKFPLNKEVFDKAPNLKFIGRVGAGMENIDVDMAESKGIILFNAPEGNRDAVAEHSVGMLLALTNRLLIADTEVRNGIWRREENRGTEINGKTIAIIGYGNMGSAFAKRLEGFGVNIIAYDKYKSGYGNSNVSEVEMEEVYQKADIISFHIPLTDETKFLINSEYLKRFSKPIILINTSRGKILKTSDLVDAIEELRIIGACLDVLEFESSSFENFFQQELPAEYQYIIKSNRVILSPHIAGWTHESNEKLATVLANKIIKKIMQ